MSTSGGIDVVGAVASPWADAVGSPFTLGNAGTTGTLDTNTLGRQLVLQVTANASANTLTWEASEDGVNWLGFLLSPLGNFGGSPQAFNTAAANAAFVGIAPARFVRARVSTFIGGTTTFALGFHATTGVPPIIGADTELPAAVSLTDAFANPVTPPVGAMNMVWNGATWDRVKAISSMGDANGGGGIAGVGGLKWNGATWDRARVANVLKNGGGGAAGATTIWTPGAGKKFRIMAYRLSLTGDSAQAVAGEQIINVTDGGATIGLQESVWLPAASPNISGQSWQTPWIILGNGYLSTTANNVLAISLGTALTTGVCRMTVIGTEE